MYGFCHVPFAIENSTTATARQCLTPAVCYLAEGHRVTLLPAALFASLLLCVTFHAMLPCLMALTFILLD